MLGRDKCKYLREIRRRIANENDIKLVTRECTFKGECKGTCPRCEAEVLYLERELEKRQKLGRIVTIAGLSLASLACGSLLASCDERNGDVDDGSVSLYGSHVSVREKAEREALHKNIIEYLNKNGYIESEGQTDVYNFNFTVTKDGEIQNIKFYQEYAPRKDFIISLLQSMPKEELNTLQSDWKFNVTYVVKWRRIEFSIYYR